MANSQATDELQNRKHVLPIRLIAQYV